MGAARYIDTHCHLDDPLFDPDREEVILRMLGQGVVRCVTVGSDLSSSVKCLEIAALHPEVFAAAGVHPHAAEKAPGDFTDRLEELLGNGRAVALGEIGLDYHYAFASKEAQKTVLSRQLDLACRLGLPVVLHVREAHGDMLDLLRKRSGRLQGGIVHCYSGSLESAREYLALGMSISFSGSVTFKNASKLREVAALLPAERILVETDSPYLSPVPLRGRRNEPGHVRHVSDAVACLRNEAPGAFAETVWRNAQKLFGFA